MTKGPVARARSLAPFLLLALIPSVAFFATGWQATRSVWPVPIDDAYIYAQYARNFAHGRFFEWSVGDGYSRGCTSPLYPLLLAPMWLFGLRDHWLMLGAALLNTLGLAVGFMAVHRLVSESAGSRTAGVAVTVLATTGVVVWNAASGMEAGLAFGACAATALYFTRACRSDAQERAFLRLAVAQGILALLRPESLVSSAVLSAMVLAADGSVRTVRRVATLGCAPLPILAYFAMNSLNTGSALTTSMLTKSIWSDPSIPAPLLRYLERFPDWPQFFWPYVEFPLIGIDPSSAILVLALAVILVLGARSPEKAPPMYVLLVAALIQSCFLLGQRVPSGGPHMRYVMPYLPLAVAPLAVLAAASCDRVAAWTLSTFPAVPRRITMAVWGAPALLLLMALPWQLRHLSENRHAFGAQSRVLTAQQVAIGRYIAAANATAPGTYRRLYTHDAGALMYFSNIRGFDLHGLCMELPGYPIQRAQFEGAFFSFEALEHTVKDEDIPDVSAVFLGGWGGWPNAGDLILDPEVPSDPRAEIVGTDMKLFAFPRDAVRSGHFLNADEAGDWIIHDRLDVADLISERDHKFSMKRPARPPHHAEALLVDQERDPPLADVGRQILAPTAFWMSVPKGQSRIVARIQGLRPGQVDYLIGHKSETHKNTIQTNAKEGPVLVHLADLSSETTSRCLVEFEPRDRALIAIAHVYILKPLDRTKDFANSSEPDEP